MRNLVGIRFLHDAKEVFKIMVPDYYPIPGLGDTVIFADVEYAVLWRKWNYENIGQVFIDIGVERVVR